ncbi:assimilatory sulfite reductase (NADPH) flavoprotein subunit [Alkalicoccus chagannorensis]|uniref:assimilatory sulfite reductase (NADPH) flavoprotein subunit n=1 Tax=Alkalicoccus chagannorensis TaxID=427072 RepID=UPI00047DB65A|nr:assimilatory sulfite reductase (NADPH) flavoprotein subunit [Alkalicoccus chagannorensis]
MILEATNSPFTEKQAALINELTASLSTEQKQWISGYFAAGAAAAVQPPQSGSVAAEAAEPAATRTVTILTASQTGNGEALAAEWEKTLVEQGQQVQVLDMDTIKPKQWKSLEDVLIVASTHGEGEPPDNALSVHKLLHSRRAPDLSHVRFSVLALGDTSYEFFCQTGKEFDAVFEKLGAQRIAERIDCDVDYEEPAEAWFTTVQRALTVPKPQNADVTGGEEEAAASVVYSKKHPFEAEILERIQLNGRGSAKETYHLELSLEGSGLTYQPGDSLGIYPQNDPLLVDQLIQAAGWDADAAVPSQSGAEKPLRDVLVHELEMTKLSKPLLEKLYQIHPQDNLQALLDEGRWKDYIEGRDLLDVVEDFGPWKASGPETAAVLRSMPPRLYSIASSLETHPDEVHLTIGAVRYEAHGRSRRGVCSIQCAERSGPGETLRVFVQQNPKFKLPDDPDTPVIMIGAGTGIAPYRSFIEEREEQEAAGPTWLFFGEQHFTTDFLYQTEWQAWLQERKLTRMDVAFSRDQKEKIYVQHRLQERSRDVYHWLETGAVLYICGDEKHMAQDVHRTLRGIIEREGGVTAEEAEEKLEELRREKRLQRDVY